NGDRRTRVSPRPSSAPLIHELSTCATEADIVQVLFYGLQPLFKYDVVLLHVLEREGWYHSQPVDSGVLQNMRRRPLVSSAFAQHYSAPRATVVTLDPERMEQGTGPGAGRFAKFAIFVPVKHQGRVIGAVIYQSYRNRRVAPEEIDFLEEVHKRLGVQLANASLNELTRNQARRLEALNSIGRAIAASLDVASILSALRTTLSELLPVDEVKLALGNARSFEAIQEQRRRLELVNSIGRRLASSLDRWSIMRTLREELAAFLDFDGFILASITKSQEGPVAEGYQYVAGVEEVVPPVALAVTGPSREAYESGRPVLVRNSPWASSFERGGRERERWTVGHGAAVF